MKEPERFTFYPFNEDAKNTAEKLYPKNTQRTTNWAIKVFSQWKKAREDTGLELCPDNLLELAVPEDLCKWLPLCR